MSIYIYRIDEEYDFAVDYFRDDEGSMVLNFILYMLLVRTALTVIVKDYREMLMQYFLTSIPYFDMTSF